MCTEFPPLHKHKGFILELSKDPVKASQEVGEAGTAGGKEERSVVGPPAPTGIVQKKPSSKHISGNMSCWHDAKRQSLLRESFRIPAAGRVTGPVVTNRPLGWEASACSGVGPRKSRPAAPGGEGKQQGPCHGELFPPGKSNRAARGQEPEKSMFPRYNSGHPQFLQGPGRLICPLCELIGACHLRNHRAAECCS